MVRLFIDMINDGITPNGLYFLMVVTDGTGIQGGINYHSEKRLLENAGFIEDNKITEKGQLIIQKYKNVYKEAFGKKSTKTKSFNAIDDEYIYQFREIFPKGMLPSGSPARQAFKELQKRFVWFFSNYNYSWEIILKATQMYVNKYQQENYMYMKTSGYFIVKHEKGVEVSTLATYCDMVNDLIQIAKSEEPPVENTPYSSAI